MSNNNEEFKQCSFVYRLNVNGHYPGEQCTKQKQIKKAYCPSHQAYINRKMKEESEKAEVEKKSDNEEQPDVQSPSSDDESDNFDSIDNGSVKRSKRSVNSKYISNDNADEFESLKRKLSKISKQQEATEKALSQLIEKQIQEIGSLKKQLKDVSDHEDEEEGRFVQFIRESNRQMVQTLTDEIRGIALPQQHPLKADKKRKLISTLTGLIVSGIQAEGKADDNCRKMIGGMANLVSEVVNED